MKFVIGKEGRFQVYDRDSPAPKARVIYVKPGAYSNGEKYGPSIRAIGCSYSFQVKRGVAEEWRDIYHGGDRKPIYARVLPEDAEPTLSDLDAALARAREEVKRLEDERQAFLMANIIRGERIAVKHVEAAKPPAAPAESPEGTASS